MISLTRRQVFRYAGSGFLLGIGALAACGQSEPRRTPGAGRVPATPIGTATPSVALTPVVTIYPPRLTIEGTLVLPTAVPDPNGATVALKTPDPNFPIPTPYPTPRAEDPICSTLYSTWDPKAQTLIGRSESVIIATVTAIAPARWTTPDGKRPADPRTGHFTIYTPVEFRLEQVLKGVPPSPLRILSQVGTVGQDCRFLGDGFVDFTQVGERVVLFLNPLAPNDLLQPPDGGYWYIVVRFTVNADGTCANSYQTLSLTELLAIVAANAGPTPAPTAGPLPSRPSSGTPAR